VERYKLTKDNVKINLRLQILVFKQNNQNVVPFLNRVYFYARTLFYILFQMRFKSFILFLIIWVANFSYSQKKISFEIHWENPVEITRDGKVIVIPVLKDQSLNNGVLQYFNTVPLSNDKFKMVLSEVQTAPALTEEINYLKSNNISVSDTLEGEYKVTKGGNDAFAVVSVLPFIRQGKTIRRISKLTFDLQVTVTNDYQKDFVSTSVLNDGSGIWYKISVREDGIYKIDKAFLESCGISTEGLSSSSIHIFGNGDGRLPENNNVSRTDDLAQNAIFMYDGGDGTFDDGDYLLFYGWGPDRLYANGLSSLDQDRHIYSDISCYFINIHSGTPSLLVSSIPQSSLTETHLIDSYSYYDKHELDQVSLVGGGQRWYGELFDTDLERTFNFSVPDIELSSPASFSVSIATNATNSAGTEQRYSVNGTSYHSSLLPSVSADYVRNVKSFDVPGPSSTLSFKVNITRNNPNVLVYLDRIALNARRKLKFYSSQFNFRDLQSVGAGNVGKFEISSFPANGFVWDVTDRHIPKLIEGSLSSGVYTFVQEIDSLREFAVSNGFSYFLPEKVGDVSYQNLHGLDNAELLIVSHRNFISQAERLADLHRSEGLTVNVVNLDQVYNEFSSGIQDPTAIKMIAKMFYDRSLLDPTNGIKNLLLFGDGTYDPKNRVANNNYFIPTFQLLNSENHIAAMVTDDYYGMLSDDDAISPSDLQDIGVGRLLISDLLTAKQQVDKIEHYMKNGSALFPNASTCTTDALTVGNTFGDWRLKYVQIADDEETGYFVVNDTEPQFEHVKANHPDMNCDKLYTDAYMQVTTAGGQRYPDVYDGITNRIERGALVVNYVGHGGEVGLAEERIVTVPQIQSWNNIDRLNVFVSATCEFTKYDDPARVSAGEWASLNPTGGAIALMTTTRSVFFGVNTITGKRFFETVFTLDSNNEPLSFGEIMRLTKNAAGSSDNKRSFTLIGDPALKLAMPRLKIMTDSINGLDPSIEMDTIRALSKVTIKGHVEDQSGMVLNGFNGILAPSVFDKPKVQNTLGQDSDSPVIPFEIQRNIVYKGQASINNGYFEFSFVVPKDINLSYGQGKISYYGDNDQTDASGSDIRFFIGGIDPNGVNDNQGPTIELFLNDESFVDGGLSDETPILLANVFDENGVNTVGNGIGHDVTALIDGESSNPYVLNDYYKSDVDSYQSGSIRYQLPTLSSGAHTLTLKVWDVNNNSSEKTIDFVVQEKTEISLEHVLNYPNPFTTHTEFYFEHNQACDQMEVQLQIMTVSGKLVKTINQYVHTEGFRSAGIPWDGKDDFGDQLAKGVYVYRLSVKTPDGEKAEKLEKLVLLK
jgi:hypothetical protein